MKTHVAIVRDHSGSMSHLARKAADDYNKNLKKIQEETRRSGQQTFLSVVKCGVPTMFYGGNATYEVVTNNVDVLQLEEMNPQSYDTRGGSTPLWDSVAKAIAVLKQGKDDNDPDDAFLVLVITDGQENSSTLWSAKQLSDEIRKLQGTDRWTFAFRVPRGYESQMAFSLGLHSGNILPWDQTEQGLEVATGATLAGLESYYTARAAGQRSVRGFYTTDTTNLKPEDVAKTLQDISKEVTVLYVGPKEHDWKIQDFVEKKGKMAYRKGIAFYNLSKTENVVQDYKKIVIRDKASGKIYAGSQARALLGLPTFGNCKIVPGDHGQYDIFVQSTSTNRKLKEKTYLLLWPKAA